MLRIRRPTVYPIGMDVGHACVKMVQLERAGEHLSVLAAAKVPLSPDACAPANRARAAAEAVGRLLRGGPSGFRGRRAVAAVPRESLHIRNLRLPAVPPDPITAAAIPHDARASLPFDPTEAALQFLPAGEVRQGADTRQEVILLAAHRAEVNAFIHALGTSGLTLDALDVEPCALYRTVDRFVRPSDSRIDALVDVGARRTQVVVGRGGEIQFIKSVEIGGWHVEEALMRKLGIAPDELEALRQRLAGGPGALDERDPVRQAACDATRAITEELAGEVSLCLRYHAVTFRGHRADHVQLTGGGANDPQLIRVFNRALPVPAVAAMAPAGLDATRLVGRAGGPIAEWAVALGLALKCVEGTFAAPVDGGVVIERAAEVVGA